jgi:hypothetical protein
MREWKCPACFGVVPPHRIKPAGAFSCPHCRSDLRVAQPFSGGLALTSLVIPFAVLLWSHSVTLPWVVLAFISVPYIDGLLLILIRSRFALPLVVFKGPFDHFTINEGGSKGDESESEK